MAGNTIDSEPKGIRVTDITDKILTVGSSAANTFWNAVTYGSGYDIGESNSFYGSSKYDFNSRTFPYDLGADSSYNGHYMVININVSDYSNYDKLKRNNNPVPSLYNKLPGEMSKVDSLRSTIDKKYSVTNPDGNSKQLGWGVFVPRRTTRIAESIALFMPATVFHSERTSYDEIGLTDLAFRAIQAGASQVGLGGLVSAAKGIGTDIAKLSQQPINPRIEVVFSTAQLKSYVFDFLFAPANEQESETLKNIITTLRFHARPELNPFLNTGGPLLGIETLLWIPPSEFDITFYNRGKENTNIPRINTCALTGIDVDFAPTGIYSTFANGHPVTTRMQLSFTELEVPHRLRVVQGF